MKLALLNLGQQFIELLRVFDFACVNVIIRFKYFDVFSNALAKLVQSLHQDESFLLVCLLILLPCCIAYTVVIWCVFRVVVSFSRKARQDHLKELVVHKMLLGWQSSVNSVLNSIHLGISHDLQHAFFSDRNESFIDYLALDLLFLLGHDNEIDKFLLNAIAFIGSCSSFCSFGACRFFHYLVTIELWCEQNLTDWGGLVQSFVRIMELDLDFEALADQGCCILRDVKSDLIHARLRRLLSSLLGQVIAIGWLQMTQLIELVVLDVQNDAIIILSAKVEERFSHWFVRLFTQDTEDALVKSLN